MAQEAEDHEDLIRRSRISQTAAIAEGDFAKVASYWVEDVVVTAGLGFVLAGAESYRRAFEVDGGLLYERLPAEIDVSPDWPLAFESGRWSKGIPGSF